MTNFIKEEEFLGNKKILVGSKEKDMVLEAAGKIYIKLGTKTKTLNELFKLLENLNTTSTAEILSKTTIVSSTEAMNALTGMVNGNLVFNLVDKSLYIYLDGEYICLVESADGSGSFVKKSGDTMTGQLEIQTKDSPLIVVSSELVKNFNSNYVGGYSSSDIAKKKVNEYITADWTFEGTTTSNGKFIFKDNIRASKDFITDGSLGSPSFSSGYTGSGWRFDATTNTLTIDYLVVRKAMQVYELVINKISATNGSLWVTNSIKVEILSKINYITIGSESLDVSMQDDIYYIISNSIISGIQKYAFCIHDINLMKNNKIYINHPESIYTLDWLNLGITNNVYNKPATVVTDISNSLYEESDWTEFITNITYIHLFETDELYTSLTNATFEYITAEDLTLYKTTGASKITTVNIYDKYFKDESYSRIYKISDSLSQYPLMKSGDIIRCQKYQDGNIKYYDGIILSQTGANTYIIQVAGNVFDRYTEITYDELGNVTGYTIKDSSLIYSTADLDTSILGSMSIDDEIVQIGNIYNTARQGSVYITSTDDQAPFMDVIDDVCVPDYSVNYIVPIYVDGVLSQIGGVYQYKYKNSTKVRLGKLSGIYNEVFGGNQPTGYGLYGENVYLTGSFYLNNGTSVVEFSKEQIKLMFKDAGIEITEDDVTITADKVKIKNGENTTALFENGKITAGFIDATGILAHTQVAIGEYIFVDQNSSTIPDITSIKKHLGSITAIEKKALSGYALRDAEASIFSFYFNSDTEKVTAKADCITPWNNCIEYLSSNSFQILDRYINSNSINSYGIPALYTNDVFSATIYTDNGINYLNDYLLRVKLSLISNERVIGEIDYDTRLYRHELSEGVYAYNTDSMSSGLSSQFVYTTYSNDSSNTKDTINEVNSPKTFINIKKGDILYYKLDLNVMYYEDIATLIYGANYTQVTSAVGTSFTVSDLDINLFYDNDTKHPLIFEGTMSCFYTDGYFVYKDPFNYTYYKECDSSGNGLFESRIGNSVLDSNYDLTCANGSLTGFKIVVNNFEAQPMKIIVNDLTNGLKYYPVSYSNTNSESITTSYQFKNII